MALFSDADLIHIYSRAEALDDELLIDANVAGGEPLACQAGFRWPVALTVGAWEAAVGDGDGCNTSQDSKGRLWDVLTAAAMAAKAGRGIFTVEVADTATSIRLVELQIAAGPGDNFEPVVTISLPGED